MSAAAMRYHRGDKNGAAEAAASLMKLYPKDRRSIFTALTLGALAGDVDLVKRASRSLLASTAWIFFATFFPHPRVIGFSCFFGTPLPPLLPSRACSLVPAYIHSSTYCGYGVLFRCTRERHFPRYISKTVLTPFVDTLYARP